MDRWRDAALSDLERTLRSRALRMAVPDLDQQPPGRPGGHPAGQVGRVAGHIAKLLAPIGRNEVYSVGKALGYKFRPWEAVKLGAKVGRVASVLAAVGVALDGYSWYADNRRENERQAWRQEVVTWVAKTRDEIIDALVADPEGIVTYLEHAISEIDQVAKGTQLDLTDLGDRLTDLDAERNTIADLLALGRELLGVERTH